MKSKVKNASIFVTGANGGIGLETVKLLVKEGAQRIALACRTEQKAAEAMEQIPSSNTHLEPYGGFDMTDENSIRTAVRALPKFEEFDIVFLQSGGMVVSDEFQFIETKEQHIERTIYQNVFGAYITVQELKKQGLLASNARIVFAGGEGARGIKGMIDKPSFKLVEDLRSYILKGNGKYKDIQALGVSKFMSALLVQKLALLDEQNTYVWFSPGLTGGTQGLINVPQPKKFMLEKIGFPIMQLAGIAQSPKQAAIKNVDCLNEKYGRSGNLIGAPEGKGLGTLVDQKPMNKGFTNHQFRDVFWKIITENCGTINLS